MSINPGDARSPSHQRQFANRPVLERSGFHAAQRGTNVARHQLSCWSRILSSRAIRSFSIGMWNVSAVAKRPDSLVPNHLATGVDLDSAMLALLTFKLFDQRVGL